MLHADIIPAAQAGIEPVHPLLRSSVRERIRADVTCGHFLQAVVADGRRCAQRRFHVTLFQQAALLCGMRPNTREAIGLQFQFHG